MAKRGDGEARQDLASFANDMAGSPNPDPRVQRFYDEFRAQKTKGARATRALLRRHHLSLSDFSYRVPDELIPALVTLRPRTNGPD
jgi:hypothetical protein